LWLCSKRKNLRRVLATFYGNFEINIADVALRWLQDPSEISANNLNTIRCETSRNFRNNKMEYLKDKIDELATNSKNKNIWELYFFLWLCSPILGLGRLHETFHFISVTRSRTVGSTPWTGDQLVASSLLTAPGDCDNGEVGGMNGFGRGNRSTRRKPVPAPLCPPQIPLARPGHKPRPLQWEASD
jgi:hypothetical protein